MTTARGRGWPREHELPYFDGQVHFPDYRIEYESMAVNTDEDIELFTPHYVGPHAASRAKTGFRIQPEPFDDAATLSE
jgi:hypothetical protein